jgi:hypothetical protein
VRQLPREGVDRFLCARQQLAVVSYRRQARQIQRRDRTRCWFSAIVCPLLVAAKCCCRDPSP